MTENAVPDISARMHERVGRRRISTAGGCRDKTPPNGDRVCTAVDNDKSRHCVFCAMGVCPSICTVGFCAPCPAAVPPLVPVNPFSLSMLFLLLLLPLLPLLPLLLLLLMLLLLQTTPSIFAKS